MEKALSDKSRLTPFDGHFFWGNEPICLDIVNTTRDRWCHEFDQNLIFTEVRTWRTARSGCFGHYVGT
jgi:hypothetical protein